MATLVLYPHLERGGYHLDRFDAYVGDAFIVCSRQPLLDGARKLLELGYNDDEPLTMRMHNREYDSFIPKPISEWAKWTIKEAGRGPIPFNEPEEASPVDDMVA